MFKNKNILIIALIALVNMLGYGIIIPILYAYSKKFGLSDFQNGLLFATFSIFQFLATPIIGRLSDKYGRKPLLLISISGTAISFFIMAFAPSAFFLFFARAFDGVTAGNIPVALAVISDSTKPKQRTRAFGIVGAAFNFGFVFGPAISALTLHIGAGIPFIIAGVITIVAIVITALFLPETNVHKGEISDKKLFDLGKLYRTLFDPNVGTTLLISLVFYLAFACAIIYGFQPFTLKVLKISASQNALLFTIFGAVGLFTQTYLVGKVTERFGMKKTFTNSILFVLMSFVLMYFAKNITFFIAAMVLLSLVNSIAQTLIPTILSRETDEKSQGSILGLNTSYQSLGMMFGPILGGAVATSYIPNAFITGAALMIICYFLSFKVLRLGIKKESAF